MTVTEKLTTEHIKQAPKHDKPISGQEMDIVKQKDSHELNDEDTAKQNPEQSTPRDDGTRITKTTITKTDPSKSSLQTTSTITATKTSTVTTIEVTQSASSYKISPEDYESEVTIEEIDSEPCQSSQVLDKEYTTDVSKDRYEITTEDVSPKDIIKSKPIDEAYIKQKSPEVETKIAEPPKIIEVTEGVIFDPKTSLVISEAIGVSGDLLEAVNKGVVPSQNVKVVDPKTGVQISLPEAIKKGVVDEKTGKVKDTTGKKISFADAAKLGLVAVVGAPIYAASKVIEIVKNAVVVDPKTGEKLPIDQARQRGLIDSQAYGKYEEVIKSNTCQDITTSQVTEYIKTVVVVDPKSGEKLSIDDAYQRGLVEPDVYEEYKKSGQIANTEGLVSSTETSPKREILQPSSIDESSLIIRQGTMTVTDIVKTVIVDPKTGEQVTLEEALNRGLVNQKEYDTLQDTAKSYSPQNIVVSKTSETKSFLIEDPKSGKKLKLDEALEQGIIDSDTYETYEDSSKSYDVRDVYVIDPKTNEKLLLEDALKQGVIDSESYEKLKDNADHQQVSHETKVIKTILIKDPQTGENMSLEESLNRGVIDKDTYIKYNEVLKSNNPEDLMLLQRLKDFDITVTEQIVQHQVITKTTTRAGEIITSKKIEYEPTISIEQKVSEFEGPIQTVVKDGKTVSAMLIDAERQPLRVIDEITEQNVTKEKQTPVKPLYENVTLIDAIAQGKVEPKICRIIINGVESPLTVQDSLEQEQISRFVQVDVLSKNCVVLKETKPAYCVAISQRLTPEELSEMGVYDIEKGIFLNPETGAKISFEELVYSLQIFDPEAILVKDLSSKSDDYISFDEAIARPIIDKTTGHMVNPKTGKRVPFLECVQLRWIVEKPDDVSITEQVTIESALEQGLYNAQTGVIKDVNTGALVPIGEAVQKGLIDHESLLITVPRTNELVTLSDAIERGILEIHDGVITIIETQEIIEISVAIQRGLITIIRRAVSIEAIIKSQMYDSKTGKVKDILTDQLITVRDAVDRNIVHPTISEVKDTGTDKFLPLGDALDVKLVDPITGKLKDKKTGKYIPLDDALNKGLVATKSVTFTLFDIIELGYYTPENGQILNPISGKIITLKKAIHEKLVDPTEIQIKDDKSEAVVSFDKAVQSGLIDLEQGIITSPVMNLKDACDKGYLLSDKKPWTLQEGLVQGFYDPGTGLLTINNVTMTLEDAIKIGNINPEALTVRNAITGEIISLSDAIKVGIIDSKEGRVRDPVHGDKISLTDAAERGLIVPAKRKLSLPEAVFKGFYDPKTGKFSHPQSKEKVPTDRAIRKRMIDPQSTLVHFAGKVIPFEFAVDRGIVDSRTGTIFVGDEKIDFREAFERGVLVEVRKPLSLVEAIEKGVYNEISGLFMDPQTGKKYTLTEAIKLHLIDPHSVHIQDNRLGKWDKLSLPESLETGVIDDQSGKIRNINNDNEEISLRKAFEIGLLVDSKAPISLQRALHQGLYDDATGKFIDPTSNRKITLHEAIRRSVISPKYLCYFDKKSEKPLSLGECCRNEIIDRRSGKFHEPGSDVQIPLSEAMSLGLIVDIESAGFTLYDTLAMNMYNITELIFIHPVTERKITLNLAIAEELINPETSLVKHIPSSKYIKLTEAIESGIVDDENNIYVLPNGNQINLLDAKHRGLVVTTKKNLSLEEIIRNGLFRADNGKIVDPCTNEFIDINKAIDIGLLNPELTVVKDSFTNKYKPLLLAIQQGDVDVAKGRVLDTKAKKTFSIDTAFDKGLLVTVIQPITSQTISRKFVSDSAAYKQPMLREFSLDEAIKYEFIDPETAVIKDPHKNKYIPLNLAITEGIIDKNAKGSFDTQNRSRTLCFVFENGLIVYVREPLTFEQALEKGYLNVSTARFTDPSSNEVLTIKDATTLGYIDADTALIKDNLKKRLTKLPEAFRKGFMDAEKGNILDTETSKLNTLSAAIESGLLMTPKKSFTLIETLNFGIYNPTTGALNDPFITTSVIDRKRLNLDEAIQQGIVDPSSTVVKEPETGKILPLVQAIEQRLVDPVEGRLTIDAKKGISLDLVKALKKGYLLPAETRQAVEEKYRLCDDTLSKLLEWIGNVEDRLANQEAVKEDIDELRNQINTLKSIKDDLEGHQRQVSACADQAKQLLVSGGDVLAPHEVAALERGVRQLKQRCDKCSDKCDKMLRRLAAARDELAKFINELNTFNVWMDGAYRTLEDKEAALSKLDTLSSQTDDIREFVSDVIAHQADLRFITMAAQKFVDESKEFLSILNEYRTSLPSRLSHVPAGEEGAVRGAAGAARRAHGELAARAQRLQDRLRAASDRAAHHAHALARAQRFLDEVEPQVRSVLSEQVGGEPRSVEAQLSRAKHLHNEILAQGRLIDNAKDACDQLVKSLEGHLTPAEIRQLEVPVVDLTSRYHDLSEAVGSRCSELEAALLQCQGLQDSVEAQAHWLGEAEDLFKQQLVGASLVVARLEEQVREQRRAHAQLGGRRATLQALAHCAAAEPAPSRLAKKLEQRAQDIYARYEKLVERSAKRSEFLDEVSAELAQFTQQANVLDATYGQLIEQSEGRELARMPADQLGARLADLANYRDKQMPLLDECLRMGKRLVAKKDVTDTHVVLDKMKALENQWRDFNTSLEEKQKLSRQRADQLTQYESLKIQVLDWLQSMENRVSHLQPVAVDLDVIKRQQDELRPLAKEYRDYSITIDKVSEAGAAYEALHRADRADSPHRKRQLYSPTKRHTPSRTLDGRSPSPGKGSVLVSPGSTSSGFSSRRSSQDGFHLEELSPVQQQLSEINNRYSLLGTKLSDRHSELEAIREEIKKHLESFKTLNAFLDKVQRQLPKDTVPNNKEEADKIIKQARAVLEEMYEKQSILDSTKTQVRELLKRKQSVQGADRLHDEMEDVASRWKALHDGLKDKIRLMEEMKDFLDTHSNLSQWLNAKERMMAALGPISTDSSMVHTQVQQVQVLREEFRSQQPQLTHLEEVGSAVLSRLPPHSADARALQGQLHDVTHRWDDLLAKLAARAESLGTAADTAREFDAGLARLRGALAAISDKLDELAPDHEPDEQLRKIEHLERQLEGQRPLLAGLEVSGAALAGVCEAAAAQHVGARLAAAARHLDTLQRKLDHRKAELEAALKDGRNLEENVARTLGWLQSELGSLPSRLQVSADINKLQQQIQKHEPLYRDLTQREHEIIMLIDKGREMEKKPSHQNLRKDLDRIQAQWDKLKREIVDRNTRLHTAMEHCRKFHKCQESFLPWLADTEERIAKLPPPAFSKKEVEKQLRELQHIRNDIWKRAGEFENNKTLGETFISSCDVDQDVVRTQIDSMKERWDKINNEVLQQVEFLETTSRMLGEVLEKSRGVETPLQRCEERLRDAHAAPPALAAPALAALADHLQALCAPLQSVEVAVDDIVTMAEERLGPEGGARARAALEEGPRALAERLHRLQDQADLARTRLAGATAALTHFQDKVKSLSHDLSDLDKELDSMKPPGRDLKTVKQQLEDVARFYKRLEGADDLIAQAERAAEGLADSGYTADSAKTRDQVEGLRKQLAKLDERARSKEQDLDDTLSKLEAFYKAYDSVMDDVQEASEQMRSLKPVSSEVDQIRAQQKDFAELKRRTLEPLGQNVTHCNKIGQGLVRSALQGANTQALEKDLEKMNDKWNALKEKMNERERRLDVGLLQSGKFAEALAGLDKWLADTEDMVRNQKPPSADYKVVKAQLQEQKFLKKMLMDRQNSMSSLFAMGNEVAAGCEPQERKAIEKQLKGLVQRFDDLTTSAQQRMLDLEQAMKVAKQFQEELQPLVEWLGVSERKVKSLELVPTDEEKIQQKIREHKALHDDILSKQPAFKQLTETASTLMGLVGDDEATALADRLQAATDRYQTLVDHNLNVGDLLESSRKGLRHLVLTYQDLSAWMDGMEQYLAKRKLLPVHMEKLLRQMDELAEKTEEIAVKQEAVDSTVDSGLELMKHISGDEALQLKDKLDALQRRYNDLTSRGADLLRVASETLPLVQQFYNSHAKLTEWMTSAETCLQSVEPREEDILRLEVELQEFRPVLDTINSVGPQLCQISPGEGATHIEGIVTRDNRRFDAIAEQVQRKAERLLLSKKRSLEVVGDMEELVEWLRGVEARLRSAAPPSCEPAAVRAQLRDQRPLHDELAAQRVRCRDLLAQAKKVVRECGSAEEAAGVRARSEELREVMEEVGALAAARLAALEHALPLAEHFADTHLGLTSWLDDMERQIHMLAMPALRPEQIAQQQDKNEMLQQSIAGHKPLVDKLVKTGEALARLCSELDAAKLQDVLEGDCERYNALRAELRLRQQELEQALQESSQFSDKLEGMLRALSGAADQLQRAEPVSAHPPKIEDQIEENDALVEDLDKRKEAYNAVQRAASDVFSKANKSDPAVRDIRNKLDKLNKLWDEVQRSSEKRRRGLSGALGVAREFWAALRAVSSTLAELADTLAAQPPPAAHPPAIQQQQLALQEIRHEIDHTKPEVEKVRKTGSTLMSLCGEPDKPEVKKHMEDLDNAWDNITALYARREENLIDAMEKAMEFHDTLQNLQDFLDTAEDKFSRMGPLGSDIDAVKRQIAQLASFKQEVDPHMVKVEALNRSLTRQAQELTERTSSEQAAAIKQPLTEVNARWSALLRGMVERQQQLEKALLRLGQLQHALQELLAWIQNTTDTLDTLKPVAGDPQVLEVELAKLKVLVNDIAAHQASVDTLNDAGAQIVHHGTEEAGETAEKLATLNKKWRELQQKARDRQTELEDALREAQSFNAEIGDLLSWLSEVDGVIAASKPVGGLPETASEQLERFMEVYSEIEENRPKVEAVLQQGQEYIKRQEKPNPTSQLNHSLKTLKSRWDNVTARASDKKIKLEIALKEATEFHDALQAFVDWLTAAEKTLTSAKPVSRVMETLLTQIEEHKSFQKEVSTHRETMLQLDKKGTHLKYFSQKQDVILIKNLLVSVQHRWERVVSKSAERTRALDHGFKEAKEFSDMWNNLMNWLNETEEQLDQLNSEATVNDPDKIKQRLNKHREFQKALASKQPAYDLTMKTGKQLKDKAPKGDENTLKTMITDMKTKWTTVCSKAVDRQRKLEEALLYSGQFKDAMSALLDWLKKQQKLLEGDAPVHGDLDTVMALIEQHKQFEEDLHSREQQMQSVTKTGRDLEATVPLEDAANIRQQGSELKQLWDSVLSLSERKAHKLEGALKEAEKLHRSVNMLLEWLSDAETKLRFSGQLPEGDEETQQQIRDHERFVRELNEKKQDKDETITLAHSILSKAHTDAVTVIKHWITIIQSRWDEVWQWAMQRGGKLDAHMQSLRDLDLVLEELLQWLTGLENNLLSMETEPLPESIELLEGLIEDHKELMEHTQKRQNEVDRVCKAYQVKSQVQGRESTPRKVSAKSATKGTPGRGSQHDLHRDRSVSPDYYGSRRFRSRLHSRSRRGSRISPGRETPDRNLPHYGPRFPPKGSKGAEPEFRSPRVKQLWDRWRNVWLLAWERQRRLHERLAHLKELQRVSNFSWDDWRKRFLKFMNHKKSRLTDLFRKMDKDNNGLIPRNEFIDGIVNTKFDTSRLEMGAVADLFDRNGSGLIDWEEFIAALRPDWVERRGPPTDADKIHDEVKRLVMLCTCRQKFRVFQVGEGKYRFGDSQKLRLVRILRSTVMVRVGGGWVALDEFLVKNDPCRAEEFMEQLRPIFEALRQREELPCSYPLHVGSTHGTKQAFIYGHSRSQGSTTPGAHHYTHHHGYQPSPGYHWVRERTARSVPMSAGAGAAGRASRSSLSAGTPDSLSDNEAASGLGTRYRKPSVPRSTLTPGTSRPGSRAGSRAGSKPPSRHGSNLSLDSTDDATTPSRIPMRKVTNTKTSIARAAANASKLGVSTPNGSRPRTPTGYLTPASGSPTHSQPSSMASEHPKSLSHNHPAFQTQGSTKIPVYVGNRSQRTPSVERRLKLSRKSNSRENSQEPSPTSLDPSRKSEQRSPEDDSSLFSISGMTSDNEYESNMSESSGEASKPTQRGTKWSGSFTSNDLQTPGRSRIPVLKDQHTNSTLNRQRTPSGSTTPVRSGQQTAVSRLLRKPSDASESGTPATPAARRAPATPKTTEKREPFRL
ncbi:microtubule-actin cross-linking factor 1 isoform X4 [Bombyx mandarina]|uniref:Microtubule-actin cross-linking factor 1 isoform X4 n=1 Tax=Bombyx mandarina TaxID=7092 RepID=A0A6J2JJD3_BOMMA|nr:microtubule-actin cross-linking factor 1 isoform X4 [Bombyx mandarina]